MISKQRKHKLCWHTVKRSQSTCFENKTCQLQITELSNRPRYFSQEVNSESATPPKKEDCIQDAANMASKRFSIYRRTPLKSSWNSRTLADQSSTTCVTSGRDNVFSAHCEPYNRLQPSEWEQEGREINNVSEWSFGGQNIAREGEEMRSTAFTIILSRHRECKH